MTLSEFVSAQLAQYRGTDEAAGLMAALGTAKLRAAKEKGNIVTASTFAALGKQGI
jgi:hypothetical protein